MNKSFIGLLIFFISINQIAFANNKIITIAGSTTVLPVCEKWAKAYRDKTGIVVNVHGGGSTAGINATKIGTADIGACSRELSLQEKKSLHAIVIGKDVLGIIVNKKNSISNLTTEQIRKIFAGQIKNWKEVGGLDKPILVVNRESGSGTRMTFEDSVMKTVGNDKEIITPMTLKAVVNNSNAEVKETVKMIPSSIGYVSVGFIDEKVKSLQVDSVEPSTDNILSGVYPLSRNLYFLVKEKHKQLVTDFLTYVLSNEGQSYIIPEGFFPARELD